MASRTLPSGVTLSKDTFRSTGCKFAKAHANAIEIHADNAIWDTVANKYLIAGKDFEPGDIGRH